MATPTVASVSTQSSGRSVRIVRRPNGFCSDRCQSKQAHGTKQQKRKRGEGEAEKEVKDGGKNAVRMCIELPGFAAQHPNATGLTAPEQRDKDRRDEKRRSPGRARTEIKVGRGRTGRGRVGTCMQNKWMVLW